MVATGAGGIDEVMTAPEVTGEVAPDPALRDAFDEGHAAFRAAYPAIRAVQ